MFRSFTGSLRRSRSTAYAGSKNAVRLRFPAMTQTENVGGQRVVLSAILHPAAVGLGCPQPLDRQEVPVDVRPPVDRAERADELFRLRRSANRAAGKRFAVVTNIRLCDAVYAGSTAQTGTDVSERLLASHRRGADATRFGRRPVGRQSSRRSRV